MDHSAPAALAEHCPSPLMEIPHLSAVPDGYVYQSNSHLFANIVVALIDLGIITEEDAKLETVQQAVDSGMSRWFEKTAAGIEHLKPRLTLTDDLEHLDISVDKCELDSRIPGAQFFLGLAPEVGNEFCINERQAEYEQEAPGLFETALSRLYSAAASTTYLITPPVLEYMCSMTYWMGDDSEETYLAELAEEGVNVEDTEIYRKKDLEASFPGLLEPRDVLSPAKLKKLAKKGGKVGDLAKAVLALDGKGWLVRPVSPDAVSDETRLWTEVAVLRNNEKDHTYMILDDYNRESSEIGATDYVALYGCEATVESLHQALAGVQSYCEMLRRIETVLMLIAEKTVFDDNEN